jgi:hypothetical protein
MKTRFQAFAFNFNLYRYNPRVIMRLRSLNPSSLPVDVLCELRRRLRVDAAGLYHLHPVYP